MRFPILHPYQFLTMNELKSSITTSLLSLLGYLFVVLMCVFVFDVIVCVWFGGRLMCLSLLCCFPSFVLRCCLDRHRLAGDGNKWDC